MTRGRDTNLGLAEVANREIEPCSHLAIGVLGKTDGAGFGNTFKSRRNVHAVAHYVAVVVLNYISQMDPDAESCRTIGQTMAYQFGANEGVPAAKLAVCQRHCNWRRETAARRQRASVDLLRPAAPFQLFAWQPLPSSLASTLAARIDCRIFKSCPTLRRELTQVLE